MKTGTLKYRLYQNTNEKSPFKGKWYARAVQDRTMEFEDFVQHMADHNTNFSRGTINGVLMDMLDCLKHLVLDGKSVRLGELGLISVGITTSPALTAKAFNSSHNIKGVHLIVRNTKTWSNAELRKLCNISELEKNDVDTDNPDGE